MNARPMSTAAPMTMRRDKQRSRARRRELRRARPEHVDAAHGADPTPSEAPVAVDRRGGIAAHLDGADRSEERDARQVDVRPDDGAEDAPPPELALERELERLVPSVPGARSTAADAAASAADRRGCLHGGADGVAGGLLGCETTLLDPREERHEEEQRESGRPRGGSARR